MLYMALAFALSFIAAGQLAGQFKPKEQTLRILASAIWALSAGVCFFSALEELAQ